MSVTAPKVPVAVPVPRLNTTVAPPVRSWAELASRAVSVTVEVPPVATDAGLSVTVDFDASAVPTTMIVGAVEVTACPLKVALMVLEPAVVPVKLAV